MSIHPVSKMANGQGAGLSLAVKAPRIAGLLDRLGGYILASILVSAKRVAL